MSEEVNVPKTSASRVLWAIMILFLFLLAETPVHFVLGWFFHATKALPPLIANWRLLVGPLGCLVLATWLVHRFVRWWQLAKGGTPSWRFQQTWSAVALFLLGSGAAIALSGVVHQTVWLMSDPWTENRGKSAQLISTMKSGRLLLEAVQEFHQTNGRYPNTFEELESGRELPRGLMWVQCGNRGVSEPFILLHPGGESLMNADEPLIVSPVIQNLGKIEVGYGDGSLRVLPASQLGKILRSARQASPQPFPAHE